MAVRKPVVKGGWKQKGLVDRVRNEVLAHNKIVIHTT